MARTRKQSRHDLASFAALQRSDALRQQLGQELHDGVGQVLAAAALLARAAQEEAPPELRARLERLSSLIGEAHRITHDMATMWAPRLSPSQPLTERISNFMRQISRDFGCSFRVDCGDVLDGIEGDDSNQLFLIVRESAMNSIRNSGCRNIEVTATRDGSLRCLSVRDDGRGIDQDKHRAGFGIRSMHCRARSLGGTLSLATSERGGLEVRCTW